MRGEFNDSNFAILISASDLQSMPLQLILVFRIQSEVAIELLHRSSGLTRNRRFASSLNRDFHCLSDQRTTQRRDEEATCIGTGFGMLGVLEPHHVPRVLDHQMLEAATGADERNVVFPRVSNSRQRSLQTSIRASGTAKQSVKSTELLRLIRGQPHCFDWFTQNSSHVLNAVGRGNMRGIARVKVADDSDP